MDENSPRRSRRPQNKRSKASTFPLVPFLIGVIVLGFVIGAGLSMAGRHGSPGDRVADAIASPEPSPSYAPPTLAPLATHRPIAAASGPAADATEVPPSPEPRAPAPTPTTKHVARKPSPKAIAAERSPIATEVPTTPSRATPTIAAATPLQVPVTPVPLRTRTPAAIAKIVPPVIVPKSPAATTAPLPAATASAPSSIDADSDFGRLSANVVRQYLRALARGDTESAYGAFGAPPGSSGVSFPERPVMQSAAQIAAIQARGSGDEQTVSVTISTSNGPYYATFSVHRTATGAAVIVSHSINKG